MEPMGSYIESYKVIQKGTTMEPMGILLLMDKILHHFKYPKLWYIPYNG